MAYRDINQFLNQYGSVINPTGLTADKIQQVNNRAFTTPYGGVANPQIDYSTAEMMNPAIMNPLDYAVSPGVGESLMGGLQNVGMGTQLLGSKFGGSTVGQSLFGKGFGSGPGTVVGNPFTQNVSAGSFTPQGSPQPFIDGTTGVGTVQNVATPTQAASNYFQNLKGGSVTAGLPTYLAGRVVRSAFDDDDPTTFTAGEMLGAGISGVGAGSAIAGMIPAASPLAALGPYGWLIGLGISLFGGKKKRDKARKLQREYEQKLEERNQKIINTYRESVTEARDARDRQEAEQRYYQRTAGYNNPYGTGNFRYGSMEKGGKVPEYFLGGFFNAVTSFVDDVVGGVGDAVGGVAGGLTDIISGGVDAAGGILQGGLGAGSDILQGVADPVFDIAQDVADVTINPIMDNIGRPIFDQVGQGIDSIFQGIIIPGIETGIDLGGDVLDLAADAVTGIVEGVGENIVFPAMDFGIDFVTGLGEDVVDLFGGSDPEMPPIPEIQMQPAGPAAIPQIKTIGAYGPGNLAVNPYGLSGGSGSAGFITGKADKKENIYQQANIG
tara:strand:+ start:11298 stop:12953 length:1656 start_codon:yes stop_codon:yes gene_type:complete